MKKFEQLVAFLDEQTEFVLDSDEYARKNQQTAGETVRVTIRERV